MKIKNSVTISLSFAALFVCFSCQPVSYEGSGKYINLFNYHKVTVRTDLSMDVYAPMMCNHEISYPGVSAINLCDTMQVEPGSVSPDGRQVEFSIRNNTGEYQPCLWMVITILDKDVDLVSEPDATNAIRESVFVFGPLADQEKADISLEFDPGKFDSSYSFEFNLLAISPRLVFTANPDDPLEDSLYSVDTSGDDLYRITRGFRRNLEAAWSPGNELIVFKNLEYTGANQLYVVHPDGSNVTLVTKNTPDVTSCEPSFAPDGKHIVYSCENRTPGSSQDICINTIKGDDERVIAVGTGWYHDRYFWPNWSPDGNRIIWFARHPVKYNRYYFFRQDINPETMELEGPLVTVNEVFDGDTLGAATHLYLIKSRIYWAPDSAHATLVAGLYEKNGADWVRYFNGLIIIDLEQMINDGPMVFPLDYSTLLKDYNPKEEEFKNPSFFTEGSFLSYGREYPDSSNVILNIFLDPDYDPVSLDENVMVEDKNIIRELNWPPPLKPGAYR